MPKDSPGKRNQRPSIIDQGGGTLASLTKNPPRQTSLGSLTMKGRHAPTLIEEAVVYLHALAHYHESELTPNELRFIAQCKRNLAVIHRRLNADK